MSSVVDDEQRASNGRAGARVRQGRSVIDDREAGMVEPRGIEPLTFAMPLPEKQPETLFLHAFSLRYLREHSKNIAVLRYRCDTSVSVAKVSHEGPAAPRPECHSLRMQ